MPQIIIDIIIAVGGLLLGAGIKAYIDLRKVKPEVEAIQAQADESEAKADKTKAEAWVMLITSYQGRFDQMERRITDQGCEIDKITQARIQAQKERDEMKGQVDDLMRNVDRLTQARERTERERDNLQVKLYALENERIPAMEKEMARIPAMEEEILALREQIVALGGKPKTGPLGKPVTP